MLWSSFSETGYTTGIAISDSGKVAGPWRQQAEPFFRGDGGHAMIFRRFDGVLMVALHSPNRSPAERCHLIEVEDTADTLRCQTSVQTKPGPALAADKGSAPWLLAYFRQRYEGRVEIDADGHARQVPLPNPMKEERLHLALSDDGRHWEPLNGNKPVWDHWLRDPGQRQLFLSSATIKTFHWWRVNHWSICGFRYEIERAGGELRALARAPCG